MSRSHTASTGEGWLRACGVVLALVILLLALFPSVWIPWMAQRGWELATESLPELRMAAAGAALLLLMVALSRPFARDWRLYRQRLQLAKDERADAGRVLAEIEGRPMAWVITGALLVVIGFVLFYRGDWIHPFLAHDSIADTATALFYLVAIVLVAFEIIRQSGIFPRAGLQRWLLIPLLAGFVLIAGEELDWLKGPPPPGFGAESGVSDADSGSALQRIPLPALGEDGRWTTHVYESEAWVRTIGALLGIILPLLMLAFPSVAQWLWAIGAPLPSRIVQMGFAVVAVLPSTDTAARWWGAEIAMSELRELLFAGMWLVLVWQMVRSNVVDEPRPAALARL